MPDGSLLNILTEAVVASPLASVACGLGALPIFMPVLDPKRHIGLGYGLAGAVFLSLSKGRLRNN